MLESIILGSIQGIAEWLPVSSEGLIVLIQVAVFGNSSVAEAIQYSLFLHLGTFFAALIYFWPKVKELLASLFSYKKQNLEVRKELNFYIIVTVISGTLGFLFLSLLGKLEGNFVVAGKLIMIAIGVLLLVTAFLQFKKESGGARKAGGAKTTDSLWLGITQALAILPGVSRSGSTTGVLLLRGFKEDSALEMSFILSLPIVLFGNIILNLDKTIFSIDNLLALMASFTFGMLTIHLLLKLARKINFGWFVLIFAFVTILSALLVN